MPAELHRQPLESEPSKTTPGGWRHPEFDAVPPKPLSNLVHVIDVDFDVVRGVIHPRCMVSVDSVDGGVDVGEWMSGCGHGHTSFLLFGGIYPEGWVGRIG
jgi:hypothetical protein